MKRIITIIIVVVLALSIMPKCGIAEETGSDTTETYTVTFNVELSTPCDIPDGYGFLGKGSTSFMNCTAVYEAGAQLSECDIPEIRVEGNGVEIIESNMPYVGQTVTQDMTFTLKLNNDDAVPAMFKAVNTDGYNLCGMVSPSNTADDTPEPDTTETYMAMIKKGTVLTESDIPKVSLPTGSMYEGIGYSPEPLGHVMNEPTEFVYTMIPIHGVRFHVAAANINVYQAVRHGEAAQAPEVPDIKDYIFFGWDKDFSQVVEEMDIYGLMYKYGDVNMDNGINTDDAVYVLRNSAGLITLSDNALTLADMNGDNTVNTADAVLILKQCVYC